MIEQPAPISKPLREAFCLALARYHNWRTGESEPEISLELQSHPISWICQLVSVHDDALDAETLNILFQSVRGVDERPPAELTFASAAQFLERLIRERMAHHRRMRERE